MGRTKTGRTIRVFTRIGEKLDKKLRSICTSRRICRTEAVAEAIEYWAIQPPKSAAHPANEGVSGDAESTLSNRTATPEELLRWRREIAMLVRILESGNSDAVSGMVMNLEWAFAWIRTHGEPEDQKTNED